MNSTLKHAFTLIGYKLLFSLVAFAFLAYFYSESTFFVYSCITGALYLMASYSYLWRVGKTDSRDKFNIKNVLLPIIISELLVLIITLLEIFMPNDVTLTLYYAYQLVYRGLISSTSSKLLVILPIFIVGCIAYILGYKKIEIFDGFILKLVYKDKKRGQNE